MSPLPEAPRPPWWRGSRGEWLVAVQLLLMAVVFFAPRAWPGWRGVPQPVAGTSIALGALLLAIGVLLLGAGIFRLGPNLTPLPYPKDGSRLVRSGAYALVRHPIYGGGVLLALGWSLAVRGPLTFVYAVALFLFLDRKSAREETWLAAKFPEYPGYRSSVRKLIPFIY